MIIEALILWVKNLVTVAPNRQFHHDSDENRESGQGLVEYALILVLVSVAAIGLMMLVGPAISNMFSNILVNVQGAG